MLISRGTRSISKQTYGCFSDSQTFGKWIQLFSSVLFHYLLTSSTGTNLFCMTGDLNHTIYFPCFQWLKCINEKKNSIYLLGRVLNERLLMWNALAKGSLCWNECELTPHKSDKQQEFTREHLYATRTAWSTANIELIKKHKWPSPWNSFGWRKHHRQHENLHGTWKR